MPDHDIGLYGLAVMGQNLVLNMERNGYAVTAYNRTHSVTEEFVAGPAKGKNILPAASVEEMIAALKTPRRVMLMVKAGVVVDKVIEQLRPHLDPGDIIIDGGNSFYKDTERRAEELSDDGIRLLGVGISGGEYGALHGPSIMPGGALEAYGHVEPIFVDIAAEAYDGEPCVAYLGSGGAGHYVKMVHNGIEYGFMQSIAEAYDLMRRGLGLSTDRLHEVFARWNDGLLSSFLVEITADIFEHADPETGQPLVDVILDRAKQKGTGKWTSQEAMDLGIPIPTISAAVDARFVSALKAERVSAAGALPGPDPAYKGGRDKMVESIGDALYASVLCTFAQGMAMLDEASGEYDYNFNLREVARIWRAGCIIRAGFLDDIRQMYAEHPDAPNLLVTPFFKEALAARQESWRQVVQTGAALGIPVPAMGASLAYYDGYRAARLPANLIQAQRDYFGAHTYERIDREEGETFHTEWEE
jgi:6-phosphogluconate dehydrogenase